MTGFRIKIEEDIIAEFERYTLIKPDGEEVTIAYTDHDIHGYTAMSDIRDAISTMANHLGIQMFIQETDEE
jgi:hypothetical protein